MLYQAPIKDIELIKNYKCEKLISYFKIFKYNYCFL